MQCLFSTCLKLTLVAYLVALCGFCDVDSLLSSQMQLGKRLLSPLRQFVCFGLADLSNHERVSPLAVHEERRRIGFLFCETNSDGFELSLRGFSSDPLLENGRFQSKYDAQSLLRRSGLRSVFILPFLPGTDRQ